MRCLSGTSLAMFEQAVIDATAAFNEITQIWQRAEKDRLEAQTKLEKAQRAFDEAYADFQSRAPGGPWATRSLGRSSGRAAIERAVLTHDSRNAVTA